VTSPTGAAIRDIISILKRRFPSIPVIIYPTAVQGSQAAAQIVSAIQMANARKECDVLIVGRGGGSLEDLWPFNEESVARAVYASEIPTVSAVGHEIDFTITDFVADQRASTPSAAAELLSPDQAEYKQYLDKVLQRLKRQIMERLADAHQSLTYLNKRLRHPGQRIQDQSQRLDELEQRLQRGLKNYLKQKQYQLANLSRALNTISPLATLERGYTITMLDDKVLHDTKTVKVGDQIVTKLHQGELLSTVEAIIKN
jgi:exodeoxyribonuclease VII large subunit